MGVLELNILVLTNLEWRWGTAEKEGCSSSAGRLPRRRGGAGNANDGISDSPIAVTHRGMLLIKLEYAGHQVDRLVRDIGVVTPVGKKAFSFGEPSGIPYF